MQNILHDNLSGILANLEALSALQVPVVGDATSPDAALVLGQQASQAMAKIIESIQNQVPRLRLAIETMHDLSLAREPDIERLTWDLFVSSHGGNRPLDYSGALSAAQRFIGMRNDMRTKNPGALSPSPVSQASAGPVHRSHYVHTTR
jgi:hypothetical protein